MFITHDLHTVKDFIRENWLKAVSLIAIAFLAYHAETAMWRVWSMSSPAETVAPLLAAIGLLTATQLKAEVLPHYRQWRFVFGCVLLVWPVLPVVLINEYEPRLVGVIGIGFNSPLFELYYRYIGQHYDTITGIIGAIGWVVLLAAPDPAAPIRYLPFRLTHGQRAWTVLVAYTYASSMVHIGLLWWSWPTTPENEWVDVWLNFYQHVHHMLWWCYLPMAAACLLGFPWYVQKKLERDFGDYTYLWVIGSLVTFPAIGVGYAVWLYSFGLYYRVAFMLLQILLPMLSLAAALLWLRHVENLPHRMMGVLELEQRGILSFTWHRYKRRQKQMEPEQEQD